MGDSTHYSKPNNLRISYQNYLSGFGKFTEAVTINLKFRHPTHQIQWRDDMAEPTARWFLERLNKRIFGRRYSGGHKHLAVVISYEQGRLTGRPHFHIAIERPDHLRKDHFHRQLQDVFKRMDWGFGTIDIRPYKSSHFLRYICKGNFENFLLSNCARG